MVVPSPVPPKRREVELSAWVNDSKIRSIRSEEMPIPVSVTAKCSVSLWPSGDTLQGDRAGFRKLDRIAGQVDDHLGDSQGIPHEVP